MNVASSIRQRRQTENEYGSESQESSNNSDDHSLESSSGQSDDEGSRFSRGASQTEEVKIAAAATSKHISYLRYTVLVLILLTGILVSTGTYLALNAQEVSVSGNQYSLYVDVMDTAYSYHAVNVREALSTLTDSLIATSAVLNQSFPYVTLSNDWEVAAQQFLQASGAEMIFFLPLVSNVSSWNRYSLEEDWWNVSIRTAERARWLRHPDLFQETDRNPLFVTNGDDKRITKIGSDGEVHLPLWMSSPTPMNTSFINFDMISLPWMQRILPSIAVLEERKFGSWQPAPLHGQRNATHYC